MFKSENTSFSSLASCRVAPGTIGINRLRNLLLVAVFGLVSGCSFQDFALDTVGDMLSSGGTSFSGDDDVELIGEALPFSLKLTDSLLRERPGHRGLLRTAAEGYVLYSYVYVQLEAEKAAHEDLVRARFLRDRARKLYFRGFDYAIRGLELNQPDLGRAIKQDPALVASRIRSDQSEEVPFLYWAAAALGLAISVSKDDPRMLARLPEVEALLHRALDIEESFNRGSLHEFALILAAALPHQADRKVIDRHYQRAMELSEGKRASLYVSYAMAVPLRGQDRRTFEDLIKKALMIEPDAVEGETLQNTIAQRRARWLLGRTDELFLE